MAKRHGKDEVRNFSFVLRAVTYSRLKHMAVDKGMSLGAFVEEILERVITGGAQGSEIVRDNNLIYNDNGELVEDDGKIKKAMLKADVVFDLKQGEDEPPPGLPE